MMPHSSTRVPCGPSRRTVLAGGGALIVGYALTSAFAQEVVQQPPDVSDATIERLPGSLDQARFLDSWIRIDADGTITVFTGKAELGQGIRTALLQVAAEELNVDPARLVLITADTGRTPNEGFTAGSQSMQNSGTAIRSAAAEIRTILLGEAARRFGVAVDTLRTEEGAVVTADGRRAGYGELVTDDLLHREATPYPVLTRSADFRWMNRPMPRVDIPAKVTGGAAYVHDMRLEGMLHARMIRAPSQGAVLQDVDASAVEGLPGVVQVVRNGSFLAVVAEKEFQAIQAMRVLSEAVTWREEPRLPDPSGLYEALVEMAGEVGVVAEAGSPDLPEGANVHRAAFNRPYQIHGSIGPSCAVAVMEAERLTVWSHTQGVYPDREAIAELLSMPEENVRVIHAEGAGCYGHNGADDAAADAAVIARAVPGRPIRLMWMREQEHGHEPYGPAMTTRVAAVLSPEGRITHWAYDVWSNTHSTRPGGAGALLAGRAVDPPFQPNPPQLRITPSGNGDRNAIPLYAIPNLRVLWHFIPQMPLRVSALRALGAYANVFSLESFMDDLARAAGADPVAFRLAHLEDERARAVVEEAAARFGWSDWQAGPDRGRGFAFARYKNHAAYLALAVEVRVDRATGRVDVDRVVAAIDSGQAVNPDGIRNQTEGGIIQSLSWTLFEAVTFDRTRVTSIDWSSYPMMRFASVPRSIEVHIMDRPGEPFLGTGEAAQGPTGAALGNAIRDAVGVRLRDLPLTRDKLRQALAGNPAPGPA